MPTILLIDDHDVVRDGIARTLADLGYAIRQLGDGSDAVKSVRREPPDLVLTDLHMPGLSGIELCRQLKADPVLRLIPVVVMTSEPTHENELAAIAAGADAFFAKLPTDPTFVARIRVLVRERALNQRLDPAENVLFATARAVAARNPYALAHSERVGQYARALGVAVGLSADEGELLHTAGILHDIGKIGVPDSALLATGPLAPDDLAAIRQHPVLGEWICSSLQSIRPALPIIRHHHERFDGLGYPDGLYGHEIPELARIMAIADGWDAMRNMRPHRAPRTVESALLELDRGAGSQWDPELVALFRGLVAQGALNEVAY